MSCTIQSMPAASPLPVNALQAPMRQCRPVSWSSSSTSLISLELSAPAMSCLFANTSNEAPARRCTRTGTTTARQHVSDHWCGAFLGVGRKRGRGNVDREAWSQKHGQGSISHANAPLAHTPLGQAGSGAPPCSPAAAPYLQSRRPR